MHQLFKDNSCYKILETTVNLAGNSNPKEEQGTHSKCNRSKCNSKAMQVTPKHHTAKILTSYDNILDGNYERKGQLFSASLTTYATASAVWSFLLLHPPA